MAKTWPCWVSRPGAKTKHKGYLAIDNPQKYLDVLAGKVPPYALRAEAVIDPFPAKCVKRQEASAGVFSAVYGGGRS
jgi:hypothetical protein